MEIKTQLIGPFLAFVSSIVVAGIGYGKLTQRTNDLDSAVNLPDGSWRFAIHSEVKDSIDKIEKKLDGIHNVQVEVAKLMGKVEGYLKDNGSANRSK
ncbi:MAG: hypothetical protein ACW99J_16180 [Candidatus Thorarchaeota archaeon]|jgi:hypothetical protein